MNLDALTPLADHVPVYPPEGDDHASKAIRNFAADNNFEYRLEDPTLVTFPRNNYMNLPAYLGMIGPAAPKNAYHILTGELSGYPFTMYLMWDDIIYGRHYRNPSERQKIDYIRQQTTGIIKIKLPKLFPQIVLDSNRNDRVWSSIRTEFDRSQVLRLEGDFPQHFDLYVPRGLHINALSLLAPNMMQLLKDHSGLVDVEFYGNEMVFMTRRMLYDPVNMGLIEKALSEQLSYIDRLLQSWSYSPQTEPFDTLSRPAIGGNTLKIGSFRISAKVQLIGICIMFVALALIISAIN